MKDCSSTTNSTDDSNRVRSIVHSFSLESAYGSVKPSQCPEDFKEISRIAKEDKAEQTARELNQS